MDDNRHMRRLPCALLVALALAASGCVSAQAKGDPGGPDLVPPAPPPHTIVPVEIVDEPATPPAPPPPGPIIVRPSSRPPAAKHEKPADKPGEKPEMTVVAPRPAAAQCPCRRSRRRRM